MTKSSAMSNMPLAGAQKSTAVFEDECDSEKSTDVGCDYHCDTSSQASEASQSSSPSPYQNPIDLAASTQIKTPFLRQHGFSSLNALNSEGKSALNVAANLGDAEVAQALLDDEDFSHVNAKDASIFKWTALHEASDAGHVNIMKMIMDHPRFTGTNTRDRNGRTCLHFAACRGNVKAVETIIHHPRFASIGIKDHLGFTPQQMANANGHEAASKALQTRVPSSKPPGLSISQTKEQQSKVQLSL
jgi:ankyrin repeat protein